MPESTTQSNTGPALAELASRFRSHNRRSAEAKLEGARTLLEAREIAQHGQWASFVEDAGISPRTASRLIRLARAGVKSADMADLSEEGCETVIREALEITRIGAEYADADRARMPWQLSGDEIRAQRWEFAGAMVSAVAALPVDQREQALA